MSDKRLLERIFRYMLAVSSGLNERVDIGAVAAFFNPASDISWASYAVPIHP